MSPQDLSDCQRQGFHPAIIAMLDAADFHPAGDHKHADGTTSPAFVRQGSLPHIGIVLDPRCDVREVITAIFDAGRQQGHEGLAASFMSFFDRCRRIPPAADVSTLEKRLAVLEARQGDNQTTRQGEAPTV
jgi:hypothetical protein